LFDREDVFFHADGLNRLAKSINLIGQVIAIKIFPPNLFLPKGGFSLYIAVIALL
jgi:hypothetical protein